MIESFFSISLIIFYSILFGATMKIADLLNEHGLKWFKGSAIIFGIVWGIFGALLVLSNNLIANLVLAMNLAYLVRNRLDYLNHQIAVSIIFIIFLFSANFMPYLFLPFYFIFLIFGSLRDYIGDKIKKKSSFQTFYENVKWYYPLSTLIYCLIYGNWIVFWSITLCAVSYDFTKYIYNQKGYN